MISVLYFSKQESLNLSMSCLSSELLAKMPTMNGHQSFKWLVKVQHVHGGKMLRTVEGNLFCLQATTRSMKFFFMKLS